MCNLLLCCWKRVFAMTSSFSWQNSVSLCLLHFILQGPPNHFSVYLKFCKSIILQKKLACFHVLVKKGTPLRDGGRGEHHLALRASWTHLLPFHLWREFVLGERSGYERGSEMTKWSLAGVLFSPWGEWKFHSEELGWCWEEGKGSAPSFISPPRKGI